MLFDLLNSCLSIRLLTFAIQASLLARTLQRQGLAQRANFEKELSDRATRIEQLEWDLEFAQQRATAAEAAKTATEEKAAKERAEHASYREAKVEETRKLLGEARRASGIYRDLLMSVGKEV